MEKNKDGKIVLEEDELKKLAEDTAKATTDALVEKYKLDKPQGPTIIQAAVSPGSEVKKWQKTVEYFHALADKDFATVKALSEGTDSAGGYLVPPEFSSALIATIENYGSARRNSTAITMSGETFNLSSLTGKITAYWVAESSAITASQTTFGRPVLTAKKIAGLTAWSSELFEDSTLNIIDNLVMLFAEAFAAEEDNEFYNGDGTNFTGILNVAGTISTPINGSSVANNIAYDHVVNITHSLSQGKLAGVPKFHMSRTVKAEFSKIKDDNGNPILVDGRGSIPPSILGYEVEINEKLPAASSVSVSSAFAVFGNTKPWCYFGDRRKVGTKILDEGTVGSDNLGEKDMEALRVTERVSVLIAVPANLAVFSTTA